GILQAHRRFSAPALAPVVSSLVVIAAYIAFLPLGAGSQNRLATLPRSAELVLSVGTTAGVAALVLTALGPALRLRLRLRPGPRCASRTASPGGSGAWRGWVPPRSSRRTRPCW